MEIKGGSEEVVGRAGGGNRGVKITMIRAVKQAARNAPYPLILRMRSLSFGPCK